MNSYKQLIWFIASVGLTMFIPFVTQAQGPGDEPFPSAPEVPIDGGLSMLAVAGVGYAIKRIKKNNK